jgi:hypothetical protein
MTRRLAPAERYDLAMHLIGVHQDAAAVHSAPEDNLSAHHHEHTGPGGLRNHPYYDHSYRPDKVEAVLEEAEEECSSSSPASSPFSSWPDGGQSS